MPDTRNRRFISEASANSSTPLLSPRLLALVGVLVFFVAAVLFVTCFCCVCHSRRSRKRTVRVNRAPKSVPLFSKEISEIGAKDTVEDRVNGEVKIGIADLSKKNKTKQYELTDEEAVATGAAKSQKSAESDAVSSGSKSDAAPDAQGNIGWGRWYSLRELEIATHFFSEENVIGEGGYGVVYRGVLPDGSVVAVKNLLNKKGQAEKEFKVEVEAIGKVRHKNLVGLVGYCAEGPQRMLIYEYIDNGNLEQWLHGDVGPISPLSWEIRMKIAVGTAKGLAYLHEGLEPKVVHRDVKSSNILLDRKWNPKLSDFGLAKLLGSESTHVTTRVMGTFGYVSPEYASTGMLNEGSDVYSFGVLLMELISGRSPIDYSRPAGEMSLVDWFKTMVANHQAEEIIDPRIAAQPSPRSLKRVLLVGLRCIDLDASKRPKMGQIVHMLETDDFPFRTELRAAREKNSPSRAAELSNIQCPSKYIAGSPEERLRWR
ncbi:hypothetical protein SAY86_003870 [Trapa natans]|uniref:non-specific serine/threonine protein kinase n=1 Tax=Trapa natans TaxID=22666 RepID=A0AAN7N551_TRANT|nr:hypothetical protein SAY86_003870 [Trapa natans]